MGIGVLSNQTVKSVEFIVGNTNGVNNLGFSVDNQKLVLTPGAKETLKIIWNPNEMVTRQTNRDLDTKLKNWIDVDGEQEASFSITAKIESNSYIWNIYASAVI